MDLVSDFHVEKSPYPMSMLFVIEMEFIVTNLSRNIDIQITSLHGTTALQFQEIGCCVTVLWMKFSLSMC